MKAAYVVHVRKTSREISCPRIINHDGGSNQKSNNIKCILPECTVTNTIVHSGLVTAEQIQSAFKVVIDTEGKMVPLCQAHYKHLHRIINAEKYKHVKCFTCNAALKGFSRHCPDPIAIKHHFSQHGDVDFELTENDSICTNCYNAHLEILRDSQKTSHDHELGALLDSSMVPVGQFTEYMRYALTEATRKLGYILLKKLAILLTELYQLFVKEGRKRASEMDLDLSESQLKQEMPK